jgi:hypothetical protein
MSPTFDRNEKACNVYVLTSELGTPTTNSSGVVERTGVRVSRKDNAHQHIHQKFHPPEFLIIVSNHPIFTIRPLVPSEKRTSSPYEDDHGE